MNQKKSITPNSNINRNKIKDNENSTKDEDDDIDYDDYNDTVDTINNNNDIKENESNNEVIDKFQQIKFNSFDEPEIKEDKEYSGLEYAELDRVLDKSRKRSTIEALGMLSSSDKMIDSARLVKYDPSLFERNDPMKFGAYRRWKLAEASVKSKVGGKRKKKVNNSKNAAEKFYDAIKNLGSAPTTGGTTGTGVADPPANKGPITPKKAPIKKNRKRVITPDDIDSLFSKNENNKSKSNVIDINDNISNEVTNDEDEDNDEEDVENDENKNKKYVSSSMKSLLNEEIPQWLQDADNEEKKRRQLLKKGKKKKKTLLDDWRLWAGVIAAAAFASAFYTVYQQSGGNFNDIVNVS
eukprot:gene18270-23946_t